MVSKAVTQILFIKNILNMAYHHHQPSNVVKPSILSNYIPLNYLKVITLHITFLNNYLQSFSSHVTS
ncbi:hypothetical protein XELAEV_18028208mg [Xenopus laevis]|uniref:Uncharacterized protein n=1 Tax=Xenopus laevis TaxID=8355 RepID=A0A974CXV2_XENLA|nr:hypothetical protein XELAEV_18028208mg [Xenopus laevis]